MNPSIVLHNEVSRHKATRSRTGRAKRKRHVLNRLRKFICRRQTGGFVRNNVGLVFRISFTLGNRLRSRNCHPSLHSGETSEPDKVDFTVLELCHRISVILGEDELCFDSQGISQVGGELVKLHFLISDFLVRDCRQVENTGIRSCRSFGGSVFIWVGRGRIATTTDEGQSSYRCQTDAEKVSFQHRL